MVAVVSNLFTQTLQFRPNAIRISTAWGQPNVVSVPVQVLKEFARVKYDADCGRPGGRPPPRTVRLAPLFACAPLRFLTCSRTWLRL